MKKIIVLVGILAILVIVWYNLPWYLSTIIPDSSAAQATRGQYGDMYGVITSLFSAITVVGLIATIWLQQEELSETRKEFRQQNETLIHQRFENTFFQLLKLHNDNATKISVAGRKSFKSLYKNEFMNEIIKEQIIQHSSSTGIRKHLFTEADNIKYSKIELPMSKVKYCYSIFYNDNQADLGHYFKTIYGILLFVDNANHLGYNRDFYINIFKAQLSTYEEYLIAYHCISDYGNDLRKMILKYNILSECDYTKPYRQGLLEKELKYPGSVDTI